MSYINKNLLTDENVIYNAKIHWFIFVPGIILLISGIYLFTLTDEGGPVFGVVVVPLALYLLVKAFIFKISTELAITSKRVIAKTGLIRRNTTELNHSKVESFNVDQSITGRVLGYGTLVINGTGGGKTPIPNIDSPLVFRKEAMQSIDASQQNIGP